MPRCTCTCGARYKVPDTSLGKESKCKKCGTVFILVEEDQTLAVAAPVEEDEPVVAAPMQGQLYTPSGAPALLASEETFAASVPRSVLRRTYASDAFWTFLFPTSMSNLLTFLAIWVVFTIAQIAITPIRMLFFIAWFILFGWYAAFRFEVIESTAGGDEELPKPLGTRNFADDLVAPMLGWVGSWIVVMFPAALYVAYALDQGMLRPQEALAVFTEGVRGVLLGSTADLPALSVLIALGIVVWPMVVLCVAVGGFSTLFRPDLMVRTVGNTMPTYVTTILLIAATLLLEALVQSGKIPFLRPPGAVAGLPPPGPMALVAPKFFAATVALQVYMDIVRMRLIGLYYFHCKSKFAWSWE